MLEILQKSQLFEDLSTDELREVSLFATPFNYGNDEIFFTQGQQGNDMFVIHEGWVKMQVSLALDEYKKVAEFGPGCCFGEMAVFGGSVRTASAISVNSCSGLIISGKIFDFIKLVKKPGYAGMLRKLLIGATVSLREMTNLLTTPGYLPVQTITNIPKKTAEDLGTTSRLSPASTISIENLERFHLFRDFNTQNLSKLLPNMNILNLQKGELLFAQDTIGDCCYVVISGAMQIILSTIQNDTKTYAKVAFIPPGRPFGHLAFFDDTTRSAAALACEDVSLLQMKRSDFDKLINNNSDEGFLFLYALLDDLVYSMKSTNKRFQFASSQRQSM
jgi:CRP-like cAMP-binding protein